MTASRGACGFYFGFPNRSTRFSEKVALTAHNVREVAIMKDAGADLVLAPFADAATEAANLLPGTDGASGSEAV